MTDHRRFRYPRIGEGGPRICQDTAHSPWFLQRASIASSKFAPADIRHRIEMSSAPRSCSSRRMACATTRSRHGSIPHGRSSASGVIASSRTASRGLRKSHAAGARPAFPPGVVVAIKRMACEAPSVSGVPLARWSIAELQREAMGRGLVATSGSELRGHEGDAGDRGRLLPARSPCDRRVLPVWGDQRPHSGADHLDGVPPGNHCLRQTGAVARRVRLQLTKADDARPRLRHLVHDAADPVDGSGWVPGGAGGVRAGRSYRVGSVRAGRRSA